MKNTFLTSVLVLLLVSCSKDVKNDINPAVHGAITDATFPANFNFSTSQNLRVHFKDQEKVVFRIFGLYRNERDFIASGSVKGGIFLKEMNISSHYSSIEIERWAGSAKKTETFNTSVNGTLINQFSRNKRKSQTGAVDILYGINSGGDFFTIDLSDYSSTALSAPMQGSIALAVDTIKDKVYYHRHPNMYAYDIATSTHSLHASYTAPFNKNYARMEFNHNDGYLYTANGTALHVIDPDNGNVITSYTITGIVNSSGGGDLAFPPNGKTYMSCFSGLYEINLNGSSAQATRLSAENFPFSLTSLGYDRNNFLYAGTNDANSKLIKIDPADGSWIIVKTFSHAINDLGSVSCDINDLPQLDCDNDGVIDALDAAPCDPTIAHEEFTPSALGTGSLGFEDLWPAKGDYDFNDLVMRYRFTKYLNSSNKMVKLQAKFQIKAIGASLHNGFGLELDINPSLIQSVSGYQLTQGLVTVDGKGLETGHNGKSVIIVFDDAFDQITHPGSGPFINTQTGSPQSIADTITITIVFNQPVASDAAGDAPFNPFIFINKERGREVHLANYAPTAKMDNSYLGTMDDDTQIGAGKYFKSETNVPWAINISHEFRHPVEKKRIDEAYNYFVSWAMSNGASYEDWYKDNNGYRNTSNIYMN